ncbi:MAG TPA: hypothetical protein VGC41_14150, partial [Kofleriaceae bacterium]
MTKACLLVLLAACAGSQDHDAAPEACSDPRYGDGTCNLDLSCDAPDIDCFQTFSTDADAATWWNGVSVDALGSAAPAIAETDARFTRVRALLDAGWSAFATARPVGDLVGERPALVVVDRALTNGAFVLGEENLQPFVVMVETGSLANAAVTDDAILAVMMHELQHAIGLHKLGTVGDDLRKFYVAKSGEPMGRDQTDDPEVRKLGLAWMDMAADIGPYSQASLGGVPLDGIVFQIFDAGVTAAQKLHASACIAPLAAINADLSALAVDPVDASLTVTPASTIEADLAALATTCFTSSFPYDVLDIGAQVSHLTRAQFMAQLDAHTLSLVENVPFMTGIEAVVNDRRTTMRAAEQMFAQATGTPWTGLRYFSYEEDADDVSA